MPFSSLAIFTHWAAGCLATYDRPALPVRVMKGQHPKAAGPYHIRNCRRPTFHPTA